MHISVLQQVDQKATDLDLFFKPSKCISYLFEKVSIQLSGVLTRDITEGGTGKSFKVSLSATKAAANKKMVDTLAYLLSAVDMLPIHGEYKLWLYHKYIAMWLDLQKGVLYMHVIFQLWRHLL